MYDDGSYRVTIRDYQDGKVGKRDVSVEIKLDKVNLGGWLISDDTDLDMILRYDKGVNVADYIIECYNDWYKETVRREAQEEKERLRLEEQKAREKEAKKAEAEKNKRLNSQTTQNKN